MEYDWKGRSVSVDWLAGVVNSLVSERTAATV